MPYLVNQQHGMGWKPSLPDLRDWRHSFANAPISLTPIDFRTTGFLPSIWDQGQLGSCVMHGAPAGLVYSLAKEKKISSPDEFMPSRLFGYYEGRKREGTINEDSGLTVADGLWVMNHAGLPPESDWGYDINRFTEKPPQQAYADAPQREAIKYARVNQTLSDMQACLTAGTPIVIGFTVYESFESSSVEKTGKVPMPSSREQVLGGHCMLVVGWTADGYWICRNSWGESWGDNGYCYMPINYLVDSRLAGDFWTVQQASAPDPSPTPPAPPTPDFEAKAEQIAEAFGEIMGGEPTFVRDIHRVQGGPLVEKVWKRGGLEIGVKNLHP